MDWRFEVDQHALDPSRRLRQDSDLFTGAHVAAICHGLLDVAALIATFMIVWGELLVEVTWHNTIPDFPGLSVGVTYLPIPVGGACLLLFIVERIFLGLPPDPIPHHPEAAPFE